MSNSNEITSPLEKNPIVYFPISNSPFEFKTGLKKLENENHGHPNDQKIFQIDKQWADYLAQKQASRNENLHKYVKEKKLTEQTRNTVCQYLTEQLVAEYPSLFQLSKTEQGNRLTNLVTTEEIQLDGNFQLLYVINPQTDIPYESALDALCCQIQDDLSINQVVDGKDYISYLHLCLPNYWSADDKIGKCFLHAHMTVPAMGKIAKAANDIIYTLITQGPFVRYTWGLTSDKRLNHHPVPPQGVSREAWYGRKFDPLHPELYLRVERQLTVGFPETKAYIFTIRSYLYNVADYSRQQLKQLIFSLDTMPEDVRVYKGLSDGFDDVHAYLTRLATA